MNEQVFEIAAGIFGIPANQLNQASSPSNTPEWTSLKQMNLIVALEREFSISFSVKDIVEMENMALIIEILKEKLA